MGNAIWLLLAVPKWYLSTVLAPLSAGLLTLVPAAGTFCLLFGVVGGVMKKSGGLLFFLLSFLFSEIFVAVAGVFRGHVPNGVAGPATMAFLITQVTFCAYILYRMRNTAASTVALAIFSTSYALFSAFVGAMSFSDTWL